MAYWKSLLGTGTATAVTAAVGTLVTDPDTAWYKKQAKPDWQPPQWLFPVAWTGLYVTIAASSARVLSTLDRQRKEAVSEEAQERITKDRRGFRRALGLNLVLNASWSALFWQGRDNTISAVEAGVLAASSIDLARRASHVSKPAGVALVPYAAWTSFATVLTTQIARLNK